MTYEQRLAAYEAQLRAKYLQADRDEMAKSGEAMSDGSYPIKDEEDLKNAIRAVGRGGADHNAIRKHIMARARALELSNLVPENWGADGSLDEQKAARWTAEHRDSTLTYGDIEDALSGAIAAKFESSSGDDWSWLVDFTDDWAVYTLNGEKFQVSYAFDGTTVTLGDPTPVREVTTYVPLETKSARPAPAGRRTKKPRHRSGPAPSIEVRHFSTQGLEVRSASDGSDTIEITGNPIVYDTPYAVRDMFGEFTETMKPGVAANVLAAGCDTRFLINHAGLALARTVSGTMKLTDTPTALGFTASLDARQQLASDLAIAIERGDCNQMSCGFIVAPGGDEWASDEERSVYRFSDLLDVSAVTYPASPTTSIAVAERMMMEVPVESRARVRRMWAISRELHDGRAVAREDIDLLAAGLKSLAEVDPEDRAAPTAQDGKVMGKIKALHAAVTDALHAQAGDPDNGTDPVDDDVFTHLKNAQAHITKALQAQAVDGAPEVPAAADDAQAPEGGTDGTQNAPDPDPTTAQDGTGTRSTRSLALELEVLRMKRSHRRAA